MNICELPLAIPTFDEKNRISLGEGNTPLIKSREIGRQLGLNSLYFKLETVNPTGSYKDRFAAFAISHMLKEGKNLCVATSSGNTGAALSAYCAAAKIRCVIAVVDGITQAKTQQMLSYGAELYEINNFGKDPQVTENTFELIIKQGESGNTSFQISAYKFSPIGMAGVQNIAFELEKQLKTINHIFCPAGGGGLTLSIANGFENLLYMKKIDHFPIIHCVQPLGNDTMASSLRLGLPRGREVQCKTKISGLQVPNLIDADAVIKHLKHRNGQGHVVRDELVFTLQKKLAAEEGIFSEPAGATALAGLCEAVKREEVDADDHIVCLVTGSAFKDSVSLGKMASSGKHKKMGHDQFSTELSNLCYNGS
jgi:threonine synthase